METNINFNLTLYTFKEDDVYICYCPSLNLSGYDKTVELANKDFEYVLAEYLRTCIKNDTLNKDLEAHGWKNGVAPSIEELLKMYPHFHELMTGEAEYYRKSINVEPGKVFANEYV